MSFEERFKEMLEYVGYDLAKPPIRFSSPANLWTANMDFFNPILEELFARDFVFSQTREAEIDTTLTELLVNARIACKESSEKKVRLESYIGERGFIAHVSDEGSGFNALEVIAQRRKQLHLYDKNRIIAKDFGRKNTDIISGWGTYCLLTFANDFQYSPRGNEVAVRFDLSK